MAFASSRSPTNTRARHSLASRSASSALWLRIAISIAGFSVRAVAAIRPTSIVSGVAITSIRAVATWAWISTAGSVALPNTAGMPLARNCSTASRFSSATTNGMPAAVSSAAMRLPTRP